METQAHLFQPRPYQLEMLEESMQKNVIVAMDTGSGKTHVAVLRIQEELQNCRPDQLAWFLGPRVALCEQQHLVLKKTLPAYEHLLLCGADGVDKWTEKNLWDQVLHNVRVVVSTPDVLKDALNHGFVAMSRIALAVFDEAHHCSGKHAMNQVMKSFQFQRDNSGEDLPAILGLTASPVRKMDFKQVNEIENNLQAIISTPTLHRSELIKHSNRPVTKVQIYTPLDPPHKSIAVQRLEAAFASYDISKDPWVIELRSVHNEHTDWQLRKVILKRDTFCYKQLKTLVARSLELEEQLGPHAAEWFLCQCKDKLQGLTKHDNDGLLLDWTQAEKLYLLEMLQSVCKGVSSDILSGQYLNTHKLDVLIDLLMSNVNDELTCIVFAKQRATVAALTEFISAYAKVRSRYRVGSFVGSSATLARKTNISDLADTKAQRTFLDAFRLGDLNIMVSTDVLEEGIDVPACNMVICFDPPTHLISFMQRRGRARQVASEYIIFFPSQSTKVHAWQKEEEALSEFYTNEDRKVQEQLHAENLEEHSGQVLHVPSTNALLTLDNVLAHLHHFCNLLRGQFIDPKPTFRIHLEPDSELRSATVVLPSTLEPRLRMGQSWSRWRSEKRAKQDAAFVAYKQLFEAGLINEHLLPAIGHDKPTETTEEKEDMSASLVKVQPLYDPWVLASQLWDGTTSKIFRHRFELQSQGRSLTSCMLLLPLRIPRSLPLRIDFSAEMSFDIVVTDAEEIQAYNLSHAKAAHELMNFTVFRNQPTGEGSDFVAILTPDIVDQDLKTWVEDITHERDMPSDDADVKNLVVFDRSYFNVPHICLSFKTVKPSQPPVKPQSRQPFPDEPTMCAELQRLPVPRNFLRPMNEGEAKSDELRRKRRFVPLSHCTTIGVAWQDVLPAYILPSVQRHYRNLIIANELRTTILQSVDFNSNDLVLEAICASSAVEKSDYQRLEFLGDCSLKFLTSLYVTATMPNAPEKQLSAAKDEIVSNKRLTKAALATGLDGFIISEPFKAGYVKPMRISTVLAQAQKDQGARLLSRKTLADVVESLIGAAYLEGSGPSNDIQAGLAKATVCLSLFVDDIPWKDINVRKHQVLDTELPQPASATAYSNKVAASQLQEVQQVLGHDFSNKALLVTALTHASQCTDLSLRTYDRLEFLGDAILDLIVTTHVFQQNPAAPPPRLHLLRQCCVNGDYLAHLSMSNTITGERNVIPRISASNPDALPEVHHVQTEHALWQYMRRNLMSMDLTAVLERASTNHAHLTNNIEHLLESGHRYPWADLMAVGAPKCMSDIIESCIAAVWLDTDASINDAFAVTEHLLAHLGLMKLVRRLGDDRIEAMQPIERVHSLARSETVAYATVTPARTPEDEEKAEKEMVLTIGGQEVARMQLERVKTDEAMSASKIAYVQKARLAERAVDAWGEEGGGAGVVRMLRARRQGVLKGEEGDEEGVALADDVRGKL